MRRRIANYQRIGRFATVGLSAYIIDIGVFNLLTHSGSYALMNDKPLTAKALSALLATTYAFTANRQWTFGDTKTRSRIRNRNLQYLAFVAVNIAAAGVALGCLAVSRYALGLQSGIADNVSANVIGLGLGTALRYWGYSTWVFAHDQTRQDSPPQPR